MKSNTIFGKRRQTGTNMTEGGAFGLILRFAVPLFIGNVFQQVYNMVDSVVVGRFRHHRFPAVQEREMDAEGPPDPGADGREIRTELNGRRMPPALYSGAGGFLHGAMSPLR